MTQCKNKIIFIAFGSFAVINMLILLFVAPFTDYTWKREFDLPNILLLPIGLIFLGVLYLFVYLLRDKLLRIWGKGGIFTALLFFGEVYWCYNTYFRTGWDAGFSVWPAAVEMSYGVPVTNEWYFSLYPNNILITWIYSVILKINWRFGVLDADTGIFALVTFNCLLSALTAYLLFKIIEKLTNSCTALYAWLVYVVFMGIAPWLLIPYTDSAVLIFPAAIIYIYIYEGKNHYIKWFLIGILTYMSYHIKPQGLIPFVAIVIVEVFELFGTKDIKQFVKPMIGFAVSLLIGIAAYRLILSDTGIVLEEGRSYGLAHYVMMGLNDKVDGTWSIEDTSFSYEIDDPDERSAAAWKVAGERLKEYGFTGLLGHLVKKQLVNFNDGMFSWTYEGSDFWTEIYERKNDYISGILRSMYYDEKNRHVLATYLQGVWISILFLMGMSAIGEDRSKVLNICMLTVIGICMSQLLLEARARYLYGFVPIMLILAVVGINNIAVLIGGQLKKVLANR